MDKLKACWWKCVDLILAAQPLLATSIYFSFLLGTPPLWLSWIIALLPWPLRFWRSGRFTRFTIFDIPILIFIAGLTVGLMVSSKNNLNYEAFNTYLACVLMYYGLVNNTKSGKWYWIILGLVIILILCVISAYIFIQGAVRIYFFNQWFYDIIRQIKIAGDIIASYNVIGLVTIISLPALLALTLFRNHATVRILSLLLSLLFAFILVMDGSGGAWISIIPGLILLLFLWRRWTIAATISLSTLGFWSGLIYWQKIPMLVHMFPLSQSIVTRIAMWENTLSILKENMLKGCGLAEWSQIYINSGFGSTINAHNSYLQLYSDTGILGGIAILAAYICFMYLVFRIVKLNHRSTWYALAVGLIAAIIVGAFHAFIEVSTSAAIQQQNMITHYIGIPAIWVWSALLIVAYDHLKPSGKQNVTYN